MRFLRVVVLISCLHLIQTMMKDELRHYKISNQVYDSNEAQSQINNYESNFTELNFYLRRV